MKILAVTKNYDLIIASEKEKTICVLIDDMVKILTEKGIRPSGDFIINEITYYVGNRIKEPSGNCIFLIGDTFIDNYYETELKDSELLNLLLEIQMILSEKQ